MRACGTQSRQYLASEVGCYKTHDVVDGVMVHPSDGEAWKRFNSVHLTFQLNQGMFVLGCVQTDSTHLGHLLLLIFVGRSYS